MTTAIMIFLSTFAMVFCLGAQSLFTNNGRYAAAFLNSYLIGIAQLGILKTIPVTDNVWHIAAYLNAGPLGLLAAMYMLRKLHRRPSEQAGCAHKHSLFARLCIWLKEA